MSARTYLVQSVIADDRVIVDEHGTKLRLEPGDTVTHAALRGHGQTDEDIKNLIACKALKVKR